MAVRNKNVTIYFNKETKLFNLSIERMNMPTQTMNIDGTDARHLLDALDLVLNPRAKSPVDQEDLEKNGDLPSTAVEVALPEEE